LQQASVSVSVLVYFLFIIEKVCRKCARITAVCMVYRGAYKRDFGI